ncbi:MAG: hypothetical protein RMK79_06760 [Anaerolineae bacterium]|nr:hypothetical protein [Anaerolineae bacterium]
MAERPPAEKISQHLRKEKNFRFLEEEITMRKESGKDELINNGRTTRREFLSRGVLVLGGMISIPLSFQHQDLPLKAGPPDQEEIILIEDTKLMAGWPAEITQIVELAQKGLASQIQIRQFNNFLRAFALYENHVILGKTLPGVPSAKAILDQGKGVRVRRGPGVEHEGILDESGRIKIFPPGSELDVLAKDKDTGWLFIQWSEDGLAFQCGWITGLEEYVRVETDQETPAIAFQAYLTRRGDTATAQEESTKEPGGLYKPTPAECERIADQLPENVKAKLNSLPPYPDELKPDDESHFPTSPWHKGVVEEETPDIKSICYLGLFQEIAGLETNGQLHVRIVLYSDDTLREVVLPTDVLPLQLAVFHLERGQETLLSTMNPKEFCAIVERWPNVIEKGDPVVVCIIERVSSAKWPNFAPQVLIALQRATFQTW